MHATPDRREAKQALAEALHRLMPFHFFYERAGRPLPDFTFLEGEEIPYPYRSLLVHQNDMTPTLAAFHHSKLYLEVHEQERGEDMLLRLVTLHAAASDKPVEFGAIAIQTGLLPEEVRAGVRSGEVPLGGILRDRAMTHRGQPLAFFSVAADELIARSLNQRTGEILFGRCNQLVDSEGLVFADIVEILPRCDESERWVESVTS